MKTLEIVDNSAGLSDVPGFELAAFACDIRAKGDTSRLDLALCRSRTACEAAGVFTTNEVFAAPVRACRQTLASGKPLRGFVANSGNANACTGEQGERDAAAMAALAAEASGFAGEAFFVSSTGRIGRQMPMDKIERGIREAARAFGSDAAHGRAAAAAIMTSDTKPKTVTVRMRTRSGGVVTLAGMAKGAGMIQPGMATMLCFIATDARIGRELLQSCLRACADASFNAISVDGDMSTNDTVVVLANGESGVDVAPKSPEARLFKKALGLVCANLAEKIVGDGEKISKVVSVNVVGAKTRASAEKIARSIGNSLLVKASWCGNDPNWGRLADAAGYARVGIDQTRLDIDYDGVPVLRGGQPRDEYAKEWYKIVANPRFSITVNLNLGKARYRLLATDLTEAYVTFNKSE